MGRPIQQAKADASITLCCWFVACIASHDISAGSQPRLCLVLCALGTRWQLSWTARCRHLLRFRATNRERSGIQLQWTYRCTSHVAVRVAGDGDKPSERRLRYRGDQRPRAIYARGYPRPVPRCRSRDRHARNAMGVHALTAGFSIVRRRPSLRRPFIASGAWRGERAGAARAALR